MTKIFLLKNRTVPKDPYHDIFQESSFEPVFIPLLNHYQINEDETLSLLNSDYFLNVSKAFIITSQRAVESLAETLSKIKDASLKDQILSKLAYTVGPATYKILKELGFQDIRGGSNAGNGDILSDIILNDLERDDDIVFFTGETRRDIIPKKLSQNGVNIREIVIYKTEEKSTVLQDFLEKFKQFQNDELVWVIFFSPQGTSGIVDHLKAAGGLGENVRIGSIGPTTERYLSENNVEVDLVALKPDADHLYDGVLELH